MHASQRKLTHGLKPRHIAMIALGGIIGAGLFVGSSSAIAGAGPAATISYALAGGIVLLIMRMLGEMATTLPEVSAFTEYTRIALGDWAGFSTGWLYWYFWIIVVAAEAIAGATILARWVALPVWLMALGMLTAMMLVNVMPVRSYGEFEYWFSSLKVAAILVFIVIAGAYALGINPSRTSTFGNLTSAGGFMPSGFLSILGAVPIVIFSIAGAEVATIAAAESAEPASNIASIARSIVIRVLAFYVLSVFLIVAVVPWNKIIVGDSPFVAALEQMRIPGAANLMNGLVLVAVLSCLNSGLYVSSRVLFELAQRGDAPANLLSLNRRSVPLLAVVTSSAFGFLAVFTAVRAPAGVFRFLINASGCIMLFVYLVIAVAEVRLRRSIDAFNPGKTVTLKMWLFPWLSYAVIAAIAAIFLAMAWNRSSRPQVLSSTLAAGVTLGIFLLLERRGGARRQSRKPRLKAAGILQE